MQGQIIGFIGHQDERAWLAWVEEQTAFASEGWAEHFSIILVHLAWM